MGNEKKIIASGLALLLLDGIMANCNAQTGCTDQPYPTEKEYILPYNVGKTFSVGQGNCSQDPTDSHYNKYVYDFDLPMDEPVIAARAGVVTFTKQDVVDNQYCENCSGNRVIIYHDDGSTYALYEHLKQNGIKVQKGESVYEGQVIADSGNSGSSTEAHLHFEVFECTQTKAPDCLPDDDDAKTIPIRFRNSYPSDKENGGLVEYKETEEPCVAVKVPGCYKALPYNSMSSLSAINFLLR